MATSALLKESKKPSKDEIKESIEGNICRCTGYNSIVRAVERVAKGQYKEDSL
jgi:carbon-monoxide dehydrogenase small subunit